MQTSKRVKSILKYLPVLALLLAAVSGLLLGKGLIRPSLPSGVEATTQLSTERDHPLLVQPESPRLLPFYDGTGGTCFSHEIYTSLPPKCRTLDGTFTPLYGDEGPYGLIVPWPK